LLHVHLHAYPKKSTINCVYKPWNERHVKEFQNEPIPRELNLILYLLNNHDNFHASYLLV